MEFKQSEAMAIVIIIKIVPIIQMKTLRFVVKMKLIHILLILKNFVLNIVCVLMILIWLK